MFYCSRFYLIIPCLVLLVSLGAVSTAAVHDAVDDFEEFTNPSPSGWSYLNNSAPLRNFVFDWNEPDFGPNQGGWEGPEGQPWAGFSLITEDNADISGFGVVEGNLVTHGSTEIMFAPGFNHGDPGSGSYSISGSVNNIRQLGRSGPWQLLHNGMIVSTGEVGDEHTSFDPSLFNDGCGGVNGISSINYSEGDVISRPVFQNDFVNVDFLVETSSAVGTDVMTCVVEPSDDPYVGYYRFKEDSDDADIIDSLTGDVHGIMTDGSCSNNVPFAVVPQTGQANLRSADFTEVGHALMDGSQFVFNGSNAGSSTGDATLEWMIKVPFEEDIPNGNLAMIWSRDTGADADRFNVLGMLVLPEPLIAIRLFRATFAPPDQRVRLTSAHTITEMH